MDPYLQERDAFAVGVQQMVAKYLSFKSVYAAMLFKSLRFKQHDFINVLSLKLRG